MGSIYRVPFQLQSGSFAIDAIIGFIHVITSHSLPEPWMEAAFSGNAPCTADELQAISLAVTA